MPVAMRAGADLAQVGELRRVLGHRHRDVAHEARDVGAALRRFRAGSSEFVPQLPAHEAAGLALADRLDEIARRVGRTRDALAAADRWVGTPVVFGALDLESGRQAVRTVATQTPAHWARAQGWARAHGGGDGRWTAARVRARLGHLSRSEAAAVARRWTAADEARDAVWAQAQRSATGPVTLAREAGRDALRLAGRGDGAHGRFAATIGDDAGSVGRVLGAVSDSRIGAVARLAGRAVAVGGIVLGGVAAWEGHRDGDTEQVVTGGLAVVAGVAMVVPCPPVQLVGAVVSAGLLAHEHRDRLVDLAGAARAAVTGLF